MKKDDKFYLDMQRYIAVITVSPSTLRNQGSKGVSCVHLDMILWTEEKERNRE